MNSETVNPIPARAPPDQLAPSDILGEADDPDPGRQPGGDGHPHGLADHQARHHPEGDPAAQRLTQG